MSVKIKKQEFERTAMVYDCALLTFGGVGDSCEGRITIDNPFAGEGKIICAL